LSLSVAVMGASGRLGRLIVTAVMDAPDVVLTAALTHVDSRAIGEKIAGSAVEIRPLSDEALQGVDVIIDASLPSGLSSLLDLGGYVPIVSGTTGCDDLLLSKIEAATTSRALLHTANFTAGVTLLTRLAAMASVALPEYKVVLSETHHVHKKDAPSGTALALARAIEEAREWEKRELPIASHRVGEVVGEHTVSLVGPTERIELGHIATNRAAFAVGALRAARYLVGKPAGRYTMSDVLGLD
jgi:4-hydroxy-tetrahydrodipicolinate reductase